MKFRVDLYTRVILFDNLRNLCLLLESFLRRKTGRDDGLGPIFNSVFAGDSWLNLFNEHARDRTHFDAASANDAIKRFEQNLNFLGGPLGGTAEENFTARVFLCTVLVRHFTSHYFDAYEGLVNDESLYNRIFDRAMYAVLYTIDRVP